VVSAASRRIGAGMACRRRSLLRALAVLALMACPTVSAIGAPGPAPHDSEPDTARRLAGAFTLDGNLAGGSPRVAAEPRSLAWSGPMLDFDSDPETTWRIESPPSALRLATLASSADAAAPAAAQERHWSHLPLLADRARQLGYELPLPFGVAPVYNYLERDIDVTDVRVGVNGGGLESVTDIANFKARSVVHAALVKADAWIFPFLDVYALFGYIKNTSDVNVDVTVPALLPGRDPRRFRIRATTKLEGFVGGGGVTLAAGYRQFFAMADVNYTQTELGFDDRFRALVASGRVGWNGKVAAIPVRLWVGGAYWDTKNTASSTVEVPDVGTVRFEADQGPKHPWNAVVGGSVVIHRHLDVFAEYGFNPGDVTVVAAGLTLRF
jgi:hypothetical protein